MIEFSIKRDIGRLVSDNIYDVINAYEHALLGWCPRARYLLGKDANYFFWIVNQLPEWLGDWVLEVMQGKDRPIPQCIRDGSYSKRQK